MRKLILCIVAWPSGSTGMMRIDVKEFFEVKVVGNQSNIAINRYTNHTFGALSTSPVIRKLASALDCDIHRYMEKLCLGRGGINMNMLNKISIRLAKMKWFVQGLQCYA